MSAEHAQSEEGVASLRERLRAALPVAMKARDRTAVAALRSALAAIENAEATQAPDGVGRAGAIEQSRVGVGAADVARRALSGTDIDGIVRAEVTDRLAAAEHYEQAQPARAAALRAEAAVLRRHLDLGP